jgi:hypothetical protein
MSSSGLGNGEEWVELPGDVAQTPHDVAVANALLDAFGCVFLSSGVAAHANERDGPCTRLAGVVDADRPGPQAADTPIRGAGFSHGQGADGVR